MQKVDVAILGAGPAGTCLALQLRRMGLGVRLYHQPRRYAAVEGVAERAIAGLRYLHCEHTLATLCTPVSRNAHWGDEQFQGNPEWLVSRPLFDQTLLEDARRQGVDVVEARVQKWHPPAAGKRRQWVQCEHSKADCRAKYVVEARGRSAPHRGVEWHKGPATVALAQLWQHPPQAPQSWVCDGPEGWLWSATLNAEQSLVQCFVCSDQQRIPAKRDLSAFYLATLKGFPQPPATLKNAQVTGEVFARGAHTGLCQTLISEQSARVGDAALATDPLAGHGIYEAIGSALALAPCIRTLLKRPEDAALALAFYRQRQQHEFWRMARTGRDFYAQLSASHCSAFWQSRAVWPDSKPSHPDPSDFQAHLQRLPVSVDGWIEARQALCTATQPRGVWQVSGVALVPLLRALQIHPHISPAELAQQLQADPESLALAHRWLRTQNLLEADGRVAPIANI